MNASRRAPSSPFSASSPPVASPLLNLHDRTQFELKLRYAPPTEQKRARYRIETYLFVPRSFGLTPHTYGPDRFYSDLHTWSRFSLPPLSFSELLRAANANSPLTRLEVLLRNPAPWASPRPAEVSRELRLVGCASGVALRRALGPLLRHRTAAAAPEHVKQGLPKFLVPRFTRTMSQWLNLLIETGFRIERVEEPRPSDDSELSA